MNHICIIKDCFSQFLNFSYILLICTFYCFSIFPFGAYCRFVKQLLLANISFLRTFFYFECYFIFSCQEELFSLTSYCFKNFWLRLSLKKIKYDQYATSFSAFWRTWNWDEFILLLHSMEKRFPLQWHDTMNWANDKFPKLRLADITSPWAQGTTIVYIHKSF